jgi:hypothetical protein
MTLTSTGASFPIVIIAKDYGAGRITCILVLCGVVQLYISVHI